MQEGSGDPNLQTELNYLDSFKSYCNSSDLGFLSSRGWGCLGWSTIVYVNSGMFRGKESSNRICLSRLIQELLNFGVWAPCGSGRGRWVGVSWGIWGHGGCPHMHACMHMYTCIEIANGCQHGDIHVYHVLTCICLCTCMHRTIPYTPISTPTPIHPSTTPQRGYPQNQLKFDNTWTNQDISIPFENLKSVKNSPPMGGCIVWWVGGWVDGWVNGWGQVKSLKI